MAAKTISKILVLALVLMLTPIFALPASAESVNWSGDGQTTIQDVLHDWTVGDNTINVLSGASGILYIPARNGLHVTINVDNVASFAGEIFVGDGADATVIFNVPSGENIFSGRIDGLGMASVVKNGAGTLTMNTHHNYRGATTVNEGTLFLDHIDFSSEIVNNAHVIFHVTNTMFEYQHNGLISGSGSLTKTGDAGLRLRNNNTYTGTTTIEEGTFYVSGVLGGGNYAGNIINNGNLIFDNWGLYGSEPPIDQTLTGTISGMGGFFLEDERTLTLGGNITYTGDTAVTAAGTLVLDADYTVPANRTFTIDNDGTVIVNSGITLTNNGTISNDGAIINNGTINTRTGGITGTLPTGTGVVNNTGSVVPPTGIADIRGYTLAMIAFLLLSAALWGYILRRRLRGGGV
jgi:autotransporter-associated beta strand protein